MAFPRMAKLIDLARDILPAARSDTYDPIAPAALTDIQPPTQETDAAPSAPDTGFGINVPFEGISDPASVEPSTRELPEIFETETQDGTGPFVENDTFFFGAPITTGGGKEAAPLPPASVRTDSPSPVFEFNAPIQDQTFDFVALEQDTPLTQPTDTTPAVDGPVAGNNGGIPVHPVGCACMDCCAEGEGTAHNHNHNHDPEAYASDGGDEPVPSEGGPTSGFSTSSVSTSGINAIDSLLYGTRWGSGSSTVEMTFSFGTSNSVYLSGYSEPTNGFGEFSEHQKAATRSALDYWSNVANITFTEVTDSASVAGDLRFAKSSDPSTAWAYLPTTNPKGGDVWVGPSSSYNNMSEGTYGFATMLHEIGHALGLSHTHTGNTVATSDIDWTGYSVMSYRSYENAPLTGYTQSYYPTTPMLNDIRAIQHIYGANTSYNSGDTTYSWSTGGRVYETIWDTGGTDTIDWSNQSSAAEINLNTGVWSKLGPSYYSKYPTTEDRTLMIAENAVIENAIGGSGNDTLTGNSVANILTGGAGSDALTGGAGDDRFVFATGFGSDTISDFATSGDQIDFTSYSYLSYADILNNVSISDVNGNAVLTIGSDSVTLTGVSSSSLSADNYYGITNSGTAGDDTLTGGAANNVIDGAGGNDTIDGAGGNDTLLGGAGNDTLIGGTGADALDGGTGTDTASYSGSASGVTVDLSAGTGVGGDAEGDTLIRVENLTGSANDDTLKGNADSNTLSGGGGNDVLWGSAGVDQLNGGDGTDTLVGGSGNDTLNGDGGADTLDGQAGNDSLNGGGGNDVLIGGAGDDALAGGAADDRFVFAAGFNDDTISDFVAGAGSVDTLDFTAFGYSNYDALIAALSISQDGADTLISISGNSVRLTGVTSSDLVIDDFYGMTGGTSGGDTLTGSSGDNELNGGAGNDTIDGGAGDDTLFGGADDDTLTGGAGADALDGGSGSDTASYSGSASAVTIDLGAGTGVGGDAQGDTLIQIENVTGSANDDTIKGNAGINTLNGGDGADILWGSAGADILNGEGGADRISGGTEGDTINGGDGNDIWLSGQAGSDTINGDAGNDILSGGAGTDILNGGIGDDDLSGDAGNDTINGGDGTDTVNYSGASGAITVDLSNTSAQAIGADQDSDTISNVENVRGSSSGDSITGDSGTNVLYGLAGGDTLNGGGGADTLNGGLGDDTLQGGADGDALNGGAGTDTATYTASASAVTVDLASGSGSGGDAASDTLNSIENLIGSGQGDTLRGNGEANTLTGGSGNDNLFGRNGADTLNGDAGTDTIIAGGGNDTANGGAGADIIGGDAGDDILNGDAGNDTLRGGSDNDTINGGDDDDQLYGDGGNDVIDGGNGTDTLRYDDATGGITVDLSNASSQAIGADQGSDTISNIENVRGSWHADSITGDSGDNVFTALGGNDTLIGGDGADTLNGGSGDDILRGDAGGDTLNGGAGTDTATYATSASAVNIDLASGVASGGDAASDVLSGIENLIGTGSDDVLKGNGADNQIDGGSGADIIWGSAGADTLNGEAGADRIAGGSGNDIINGGDDNDGWLGGQAGADTINGGAGNDFIVGGNGVDTLTGGLGDDIFDYNALSEIGDSITDFEVGANGDALDLAALLVAVGYGGSDALGDSRVRATQNGSDTDVEIDTNGAGSYSTVVTLDNISAGDITVDNWIFS